jgi:tetratricopeptide (TPR) repeat protein
MNRLEILQDFYKEEPKDPFNIYGLAIEYQKHDVNKSKELFDLLLCDFEDYLATYYISGKLYEELGLDEEAIKIFKKGVSVAHAQNNTKTENELKNALINLEMEM